MSTTSTKFLLYSLSVGMLYATYVVISWAAANTSRNWEAPILATKPEASASSETNESDSILSVLVKISERPLVRPLYDPPPVNTEPEPAAPVPFPGELVGTLVDPKYSLAMFSGLSNEFRVAAVGQAMQIEGVPATVRRIAREEVELDYGGQTLTLTIKTP